jgi:hypothetical protein
MDRTSQLHYVIKIASGFDDYTHGEPLLTTLSEDVVSNYEVMKDEDKNCCKSPVLNTVVGCIGNTWISITYVVSFLHLRPTAVFVQYSQCTVVASS